MVPLLSELAQVTTEEKSLLEEASELLGLIFSLQVEIIISFYLSIGLNFSEDQSFIFAHVLQLQEESLKCHLIQLNSGLSTEHVLPARNAIATA